MAVDNTSSVRLIKKYPNRRLYDTKTSSYVTLADLKHIVLKGEEIEVIELKSNENITRQVLLQIILDEETRSPQKNSLFSSDVLLQMIRSYGNAMQNIVADYLEKNMQTFREMQTLLGKQFDRNAEGSNPKPNFSPYWNPLSSIHNSQEFMDTYMKKTRESFLDMQKAFQKQWMSSLGLQHNQDSTQGQDSPESHTTHETETHPKN